MKCAWESYLRILPEWLRSDVNRIGRDTLNELRLRINAPPELITQQGSHWLAKPVSPEDLQFCINTACRYSPWSAAGIPQGYITAPGGHRIGLCGECAVQNGKVSSIRSLRSLNIRVARDYPGIADAIPCRQASMLILGAPGWGKTTLLRDLSRRLSCRYTISVVDERGELFPDHLSAGRRMDILTGCPKPDGIEMLMKTMGPDFIAVDEISSPNDCEAIMRAVGCGVHFIASVHAGSTADFRHRPLYQKLLQMQVFQLYIVLAPDKSYRIEECS